MAQTVKVQDAKTRLSALLAAVEAGDEVIIARGDTPVARLVGYSDPGPREMGFVGYRVPEEFFEPMSDDELAVWEG